MTEREKKYLADILRSLSLIEAFLEGVTSFDLYTSDEKTKSAVERQLSIIGEAVNHFAKEQPETTIENAKQIIGLRNRLVHAYDSIDDTIIWSILMLQIIPLKKEVEKLLNG